MDCIKTKRLHLSLASMDDLLALQALDKECDGYFDFDPQGELNHDCTIEECLTIGDIPPGVKKENFVREIYHFYCIWKQDALIGFLSFYLEYQQKDTVYLSAMYLKEECRKSKLGVEILEALAQAFASAHFGFVRLHCSLRNAMALRFWVKNGFDRIVNVECDGNLYPQNFGGIELMKILLPQTQIGP